MSLWGRLLSRSREGKVTACRSAFWGPVSTWWSFSVWEGPLASWGSAIRLSASVLQGWGEDTMVQDPEQPAVSPCPCVALQGVASVLDLSITWFNSPDRSCKASPLVRVLALESGVRGGV